MSIEDEMNFVINKIREIRVEKKISQMELANIANLSQSFLANAFTWKMTVLFTPEAVLTRLPGWMFG